MKQNFKKYFNRKLMESQIVDFDKVKVGDMGESYNGNPVKIIAKAVGKSGYRKISQYDSTGAMDEVWDNYEDYGYNKEDLKTLEMVAVYESENNKYDDEDEDGYDEYVYTYGGEGVVVYK